MPSERQMHKMKSNLTLCFKKIKPGEFFAINLLLTAWENILFLAFIILEAEGETNGQFLRQASC